MGTLVPLYNQGSATLQGFQIQVPADMFTALTYLAPGGGITGAGYTGTVSSSLLAGGALMWTLVINDIANNITSTAFINDWIVLTNNTIAQVCKAANYAATYHT